MPKYSEGNQSISISMRHSLVQQINELSEQLGITRNKLIVEAIIEILKRYNKEGWG